MNVSKDIAITLSVKEFLLLRKIVASTIANNFAEDIKQDEKDLYYRMVSNILDHKVVGLKAGDY